MALPNVDECNQIHWESLNRISIPSHYNNQRPVTVRHAQVSGDFTRGPAVYQVWVLWDFRHWAPSKKVKEGWICSTPGSLSWDIQYYPALCCWVSWLHASTHCSTVLSPSNNTTSFPWSLAYREQVVDFFFFHFSGVCGGRGDGGRRTNTYNLNGCFSDKP